MRERIPGWIRTIVEIEKGAVCGICAKPIKFGDAYEIDHIYPIARGGSNSLDNLQVVHKGCNRKKGANKIMTSFDQWRQWWDLIEPNLGKLRDNQRDALENTRERITNLDIYPDKEYRIYPGGRPKIFCECTAGGKSILMIVLGFLLAQKRILIVTPSTVIKKNNFEALLDAYKYGIIPKKVFDEVKMTTLDQPNSLAYIHTVDIVVSTYHKLGKKDADRVLARLRGDEFDVVLVDEGHHYRDDNIDTTHQDIVKKFKNSIILFFTATPFDAKLNPMLSNFGKEKDVIHEFTYADAWQKGYVKYFEWTEIKPEQQVLRITHPSGKTESLALNLDEAKKLDGYKKALPRSDATKLSLIYATLQLLDQRNDDLKGKAKKNIALIIFTNIKEAEEGARILDGLRTRYKYCVVHSKISDDSLLDKIKNNVYDVILSVDMFKEGFNQNNITIVTLCRSIQSYVFFTQVIGRGVRARKDIYGNLIPVSGPARHMKDICYVITHEGLDLSRYWELFRKLDLHDLVDEREQEEESTFLFDWGSVPGNDSSLLLNYLKNDYGISQTNKTKIIKTDDKTVQVFAEDKSVEILLDENNEKATLKISDGRIDDLQVKGNGSGSLKIYKNAERKERIPSDIIEVSPLVTIIDEKVKGYASDGFDNGRTYRDETTAHYFREFVKTSGDSDLVVATEKFYNKDEGKSFSKIFQLIRSRDFVDMRNPSAPLATPLITEPLITETKKDLQRETTDRAKMLQELLRKHITRSLKQGIKFSPEKWGLLMKTMFNSFYEIYGHPLKGGASDGGYKLNPKDINFINNELPKLIEKYKSHTYFKETFLPTFKKNLEKSVKVAFRE